MCMLDLHNKHLYNTSHIVSSLYVLYEQMWTLQLDKQTAERQLVEMPFQH